MHQVPDVPRVNVIHYQALANDSQRDVLRVIVNEVVSQHHHSALTVCSTANKSELNLCCIRLRLTSLMNLMALQPPTLLPTLTRLLVTFVARLQFLLHLVGVVPVVSGLTLLLPHGVLSLLMSQ